MNNETKIIVEDVIKRNYKEIKSKIFDLGYFEKWWQDFNAIVIRESATIIFQPIFFFKITLELVKITEDTISFKYKGKILKGYGCWKIKELSANETKLSYTVRLCSNWKIINLILNTSLFKWKHRRDIIGLIKKLYQ